MHVCTFVRSTNYVHASVKANKDKVQCSGTCIHRRNPPEAMLREAKLHHARRGFSRANEQSHGQQWLALTASFCRHRHVPQKVAGRHVATHYWVAIRAMLPRCLRRRVWDRVLGCGVCSVTNGNTESSSCFLAAQYRHLLYIHACRHFCISWSIHGACFAGEPVQGRHGRNGRVFAGSGTRGTFASLLIA